ncbi:cell division protein ZapA [Pseudoalteromonas luteoviolacea]|uniref:Cell division protein ZapA n=1 Tax=Pseudoalteromonas luteoviolacea TaxID=43657 RepID=A0A1C0TMT7_9GAMM|nr:cell division protein ZapA [Pseudoalteromonas luteoviolacea]MBQ4811985.1 cell division protein ZapA [Pseudoalteromonas luteoviolacea]OCQ20122.1 cell division protein ZapA [Pseudoalteromonas luteoviolacea]
MTDKASQVAVTLLGKSHQFSCSEGQEQALVDAVTLLNERVDEMKRRDTVRTDQNALLMAALHLCHEYQALLHEQQSAQQSSQQLVARLSAHLKDK